MSTELRSMDRTIYGHIKVRTPVDSWPGAGFATPNPTPPATPAQHSTHLSHPVQVVEHGEARLAARVRDCWLRCL